MGLFYVAAAYTYGEPMQARTNNVSVVVYYENGSSNLTAEGLLPPFVLKLAAMARHICWALWRLGDSGVPPVASLAVTGLIYLL